MFIRSLARSTNQWTLNHVSIRLRLALWYGGLLAITLTLFSVTIFAIAQNQLDGSVDINLKSRAAAIANTVQSELNATNPSGQVGGPTGQTTTSPGATVGQTPGATAQPTHATTPNATPNATTAATPDATGTAKATTTPATTPTPSPSPTPVPTPDPAQVAKVQKQLTLKVPSVLGQLDLAFEVLDSRGAVNYPDPKDLKSGRLLALDRNATNAVTAAEHHGVCAYYTLHSPQPDALLRIYIYPITLPPSDGSHVSATGAQVDQANCIFAKGAPVIGVVIVAKPLNDVVSSLDTLRRLLVGGVLAAVLFASIGGWLIAGRSLEPVTTVTRTARAIAINAHASGLGRRVDYSGPRDEVGELASTFDDMLAAIERVANAQRRFVADASHELRAPLTTIKGSLEFLRRARDLPEAERAAVLDDAYTEAERMAHLVNDLLLLARVDAAQGAVGERRAILDEQLRGRRELIELDQLALDIFRHGRAQLEARHMTDFHLSIESLEPVAVRGDPGQLRQVLLILLDNAIKYTPASGKARISVTRQGTRAAISISDSGIGIPAEVRPHIFERFYRGDQARERDEHGSGLGLAIAKWIAEAHEGEISVYSQTGKGSTFTVLLPAAPHPGEQATARPVAQDATMRVRQPRSMVAGVAEAIAPITRLATTVSHPRSEKPGGAVAQPGAARTPRSIAAKNRATQGRKGARPTPTPQQPREAHTAADEGGANITARRKTQQPAPTTPTDNTAPTHASRAARSKTTRDGPA